MPHFDCTSENSLLLIIDVQERFTSAIPSIAVDAPVGASIKQLIDGCCLYDLPIMVTQQYPKGLGQSLPYVGEALKAANQVEYADKTHFSVVDDQELRLALANKDRDTIIIAGIEAHVCVLATVADLLHRGYNVVVGADAIDSRNSDHVHLAQEAMQQLGALVLPVESILFRLQRQAGVGAFKALRAIIK